MEVHPLINGRMQTAMLKGMVNPTLDAAGGGRMGDGAIWMGPILSLQSFSYVQSLIATPQPP